MENKDLFTVETTEEAAEKEPFVIDTPSKANWAIGKIKEARQRRDIFNETAENEIEVLYQKIESNNKKFERETAFLLSCLAEYMENLPTQKAKTQETFVLPNGKLKRKFAKSVLKPNEDKLIEYLQEQQETEYIKTNSYANWEAFSKLLTIQDGKVVRTDTGEIMDCISVVEKPETFDIE